MSPSSICSPSFSIAIMQHLKPSDFWKTEVYLFVCLCTAGNGAKSLAYAIQVLYSLAMPEPGGFIWLITLEAENPIPIHLFSIWSEPSCWIRVWKRASNRTMEWAASLGFSFLSSKTTNCIMKALLLWPPNYLPETPISKCHS